MASKSTLEQPSSSSLKEVNICISHLLRCRHKITCINCPECWNPRDPEFDSSLIRIQCCHKETAFLCEFCFSAVLDSLSDQPLIRKFCDIDKEYLEKIKSSFPRLYNCIFKEKKSFPTLVPKYRKTFGYEEKFKFGPNCKCQHNVELVTCGKCLIKNLEDLKKNKCLHRIPFVECNHCKNLISVLRDEKDKSRIIYIEDHDYISYSEYDKKYVLNFNRKKNETKSNKNKKEIVQNQDATVSKEGNQELKPVVDRDRKLENNNSVRGNSKMDFKILETAEEMELDQSEENLDKTDPEIIIGNENLNGKSSSTSIGNNLETGKFERVTIEKEPINRKPPPLFITNKSIENIKEILKEYDSKDYSVKTVTNKQIKLVVKTEANYIKISQKIQIARVKFYTFQFPREKIIKRLIRGLPADFELERIKSKFEEFEYGLVIKNIRQIFHTVTKIPLPLFEISFKPQSKIFEKLEKIKNIENFEIIIENLNPKFTDIPMCKACLSYGHTKRFCYVGVTCIVCTESHFSTDCPLVKKAKEENFKVTPTCLHCDGSHFSTWKGCPFYKKLRKERLEKYNQRKELKNDHVKSGPLNNEGTSTGKNVDTRTINNQIRGLELKFEKRISLLNKTIDLLKDEIKNLNKKLDNYDRSNKN